MKHQPFIGICGIKTMNELLYLQRIGRPFLSTEYFIMAGIKDPTLQFPAFRSNIVRPFLHCDYNPATDFEAMAEEIIAVIATS